MQDSIRGSLVGQDSTCSSSLQVDTVVTQALTCKDMQRLQRLWNWWTQMLMMVAININQWLNSEKHLIHIANAAVQNHEMWSYHAYGMTLLGVEALKYAQGYVPQIVVLYVVLTNEFHANWQIDQDLRHQSEQKHLRTRTTSRAQPVCFVGFDPWSLGFNRVDGDDNGDDDWWPIRNGQIEDGTRLKPHGNGVQLRISLARELSEVRCWLLRWGKVAVQIELPQKCYL